MRPDFWADVHGGATHFPIALTLGALLCDAAGVCLWHRPSGERLRHAGRYAIFLGALGTLPAVASGLALARGETLGAGALRWHHFFAWPAFILIVGAALWRGLAEGGLTRRGYACYTGAVLAAAALVAAAGYWGGELLKAFP